MSATSLIREPGEVVWLRRELLESASSGQTSINGTKPVSGVSLTPSRGLPAPSGGCLSSVCSFISDRYHQFIYCEIITFGRRTAAHPGFRPIPPDRENGDRSN